MMNLLIDLGWKMRAGVYQGAALRNAANELVDYMLFIDEPKLRTRSRAPPVSTRSLRRKDRTTAAAVRCGSSIWNGA